MGTTLTLQNSMNFVAPILKGQPLQVTLQEPAVTAGNIVLGTMLGPPCRWPFNRGSFNFPVSQAAGTDYTLALPDFRWLETQWLTDAAGNVHQVGGEIALSRDSNLSRPTRLAQQYDDNMGNITFRVGPAPDAAYTMFGDYQKKAKLIEDPSSVWGVVPDEFGYIFQQGFLGVMMLLVNDVRFPIELGFFIARLLGAQDGMSEQQKNIFVQDWMAFAGTLTRSQGMVKQGLDGRAK